VIIIEIVYIVVTSVLFQLLSIRLGRWAIDNGIQGPEARAKMFAMAWRFSDAAVAALVLFILWVPLLHVGIDGPWTVRGGSVGFWIAAIYTVLFGGMFIGGSLFAGLTVPNGDQVAYFRDRDAKMRGEGLR
jgi:hypothetical protein